MDELVAHTSDGDIEFALAWPVEGSNQSGAEATRGSLRVSLRGKAVWHGTDEATGFEWTWIEFLEFLSESWLYLSLEDGAPLGVALDTAPRMLAAAAVAGPVGGGRLTQRSQELVPGGEHRAAPARGSVLYDLLLAVLPLVGPVPPLVLVPLRARTKKNAVARHLHIQLVALANARLASEVLGNRHPAIGPQRHHTTILPTQSMPGPRTLPNTVAGPASAKGTPETPGPARAQHPSISGP